VQHFRPLFKGIVFPSPTHRLLICSTHRSRKERRLRQASKYNFGLLQPWTLTSWPPKTVHALAVGDDLCKFALKSVHSFSKYSVHKLVTDERTNKRTDEGTRRDVEYIILSMAHSTPLDWHWQYLETGNTYGVTSRSSQKKYGFSDLWDYCRLSFIFVTFYAGRGVCTMPAPSYKTMEWL